MLNKNVYTHQIMKKLIPILCLVAGLACKNGSTDAQKNNEARLKADSAMQAAKKTEINIAGLSIELKDPTCGMPISAGIVDTATVHQKLYGFCSKECKDDFLKATAAK